MIALTYDCEEILIVLTYDCEESARYILIGGVVLV
jgi:hypothetical protein